MFANVTSRGRRVRGEQRVRPSVRPESAALRRGNYVFPAVQVVVAATVCFWRDDLSSQNSNTVNDDGPPCLPGCPSDQNPPLLPLRIHVAFPLLTFLRASPPPEGVDRSPLRVYLLSPRMSINQSGR